MRRDRRTRDRLRRRLLVPVTVFALLGLTRLLTAVHEVDGYGILQGLVLLTCAWLVAWSRERL
ncbi:hypothetical protein EP30_05325 [Bifidobacterium sp. UTCIF-39]|nr:hypothetical protein EP30_05325 [Bifidobacterium sp. UTCIF-39]